MSRYTTFKHWIFNKDKKPLYVTGNNILTGDINTLAKPDGQPANLEHSPTGWRDTLIKYGRSLKYLGVLRDFTVPLNFALDGAKIIRDTLWNVGFEGVLYYGLSKYDRYAFPPTYDPYYLGEIDLSKAKQNKSKGTIDVTVLEGGPGKWLKAFENTTFEIPVSTDTEAVTVYLDGLPFTNKVEWTVYENQVFDGLTFWQLGMAIVSQEGTSQGILTNDQEFKNSIDNTNCFFNSVTKTVNANISGTIRIDYGASLDLPLRIRKVKYINGISTVITNYDIDPGVLPAGINTINFDLTIPMTQDDRLSLTVTGSGSSPGIDFTVLNGSILLNYDVTFDPTFCKGLKPLRLFQLLVAKMTDNKYSCSSSLLSAMDKLVYTSGMAIRNIDNSVIKISFSDFYQSLKRFGVMLGIENDMFILESVSRAFNPTIIANLGTVADFTIDVAEDMIYNTIKTGYRNQTYDKVNGLDEFNVTQEWTTPVLKLPKELDLVSPVRADMYGIELTRLDLFGKTTTDSSADNDTFFLSVEQGATIVYYNGAFEVITPNIIRIPKTLGFLTSTTITVAGLGVLTVTNTSYLVVGYTLLTVAETIANGSYSGSIQYSSTSIYKLYRPVFDSITGLLHPVGAFNTLLNPKKGLIDNGSFIRSFLEDPAGIIKFQTGEKNSLLSYTIGGATLIQNENIQVSDLSAPLFYAYYFEFKTKVPGNFINLMKKNPYGTIQFQDEDGKQYYGFMWDGGVKPATADSQSWKLLCSPMTNKQNLL